MGPSRSLERFGIPTIQLKWYRALKAPVVFWFAPAGGVKGIEPSDRDQIRQEHNHLIEEVRWLFLDCGAFDDHSSLIGYGHRVRGSEGGGPLAPETTGVWA